MKCMYARYDVCSTRGSALALALFYVLLLPIIVSYEEHTEALNIGLVLPILRGT